MPGCLSVAVALASSGVVLASTESRRLINDPERIAELNAVNSAGFSWVAGVNPRFDGMTVEDARPLLGAVLSPFSEHLHETLPVGSYKNDTTIPQQFDAQTNWPGLIHPIRDQQQCGSCWAFSASEVLSDRVAIATGKPSPVLSPEDLVSCDTGDAGCQGGSLPGAWTFLTNTGIVSDACFPYTAGGGVAPSCQQSCVDGESWASSLVKASSAYAINGVSQMQQELMARGPIQVGFQVYASFMSYQCGVYEKHPSETTPEGGHAVKITGWGTEGGVDYWQVANSWGPDWGLEGFFRIKRGSDECGVETMGPPYAGTAATSEAVVV